MKGVMTLNPDNFFPAPRAPPSGAFFIPISERGNAVRSDKSCEKLNAKQEPGRPFSMLFCREQMGLFENAARGSAQKNQ